MKREKKRTTKRKAERQNDNSRGKRGRGQSRKGGGFSDVMTLIITEVNHDGELLARPEEWKGQKRMPPNIYVTEAKRGASAKIGDRVLASMRRTGVHEYSAHIIRILPKEPAKNIVGIFVATKDGGGIIEPVSRKNKISYKVDKEDTKDALPGELVTGIIASHMQSHGLPKARIDKRLGDARAPHAASVIASRIHNLRSVFSDAALAEANAASSPVLTSDREDLRQLPLVTIDGEDARDFDDAVFAEPDSHPDNKDGFHIVVAIADVAYYVTEGSALDAEAFERGNSVYFPDKVIPMLPERLSNGLCSLKPDEDRYCIAVHIWIDAHGNTRNYKFIRALMRSHARLTYNEVEQHKHSGVGTKVHGWISNLYAAYLALSRERDHRGTLEINLPEYKVQFDDRGNVAQIVLRTSLASHRLIEAFMVTANVVAADFLLKSRAPGIYRVHEPPSEDKLEELGRFLKAAGYSLAKGVVTPIHLNRVLHKSKDASNAIMVHTAILRSQMQAYYDSKNLGHFGLGLKYYCHFTSPIRRYSDLIVHRSLAALMGTGKGYSAAQSLKEIAEHISQTERTAMMAERDAIDRYKIAFLAPQKEKAFFGSIVSLNEFGIFVSLEGNGITGFVPVHLLGEDFFIYDARTASFNGRQSRRSYNLGDKLSVRVIEADALKGSLIFRPEVAGGQQRPDKRAPRRQKPDRRH